MAQTKIDALDAAKAVCAALPAPQTQQEWRCASTALRSARRLAAARRYGLTAKIECGRSHRYLMADTCARHAGCYNGGGPLSDLGMMLYYRLRFADGDKAGRVDGIRAFARRSRERGPVALPDLRQPRPMRMAA